MKQSRAFTLVELIVVIFIMGLFTAFSISSMFSWTKSSQARADIATSLELHQIIVDAVKSNDVTFYENSDFTDTSLLNSGLLNWNSTSKTNIRNLIMREMGTNKYNKVKVPRQTGYAFFVYLLPPYTVVCLPINTSLDFDTSLSFNGVNEQFLLEHYPKASYPQMYETTYNITIDEDTNEKTENIGIPQLSIPNILLPSGLIDTTKLNSYVGCLNIKSDYE